jgi:hypothetical protein
VWVGFRRPTHSGCLRQFPSSLDSHVQEVCPRFMNFRFEQNLVNYRGGLSHGHFHLNQPQERADAATGKLANRNPTR